MANKGKVRLSREVVVYDANSEFEPVIGVPFIVENDKHSENIIYKAVADDSDYPFPCDECALEHLCIPIICSYEDRSDGIDIHIEKIGEIS